MIYTGTSEVGGIYVGSTEIAEVYRGTELVYQNFPKFTTFEANGTSGTKTGTLAMPRGRYRVVLVGGGGNPGFAKKQSNVPSSYYSSYTGASGGCIYGLLDVAENCYMGYCVGAVNVASTFSTLRCEAGQNGYAWNDYYPLYGGAVSGQDILSKVAVASEGTIGNLVRFSHYSAPSLSSPASVCVYAGDSDCPAINMNWGRGCSTPVCSHEGYITNNDATAGYLRIAKIS